MKILAGLLIALAMSASAFSQSPLPAAPALTVGAEFKALRFDWDPSPGAEWYHLEYRAHQNDIFLPVGEDLPPWATTTQFALQVHLFDWSYGRFRLAACNSFGCSRSSPVLVANLRRDAVGYFKAAVSKASAQLGVSIDLSPDGNNLVATAPGEVTFTSSGPVGGGVYVFGRGANGQWVQRTRINANARGRSDLSNVYLSAAVSGSGNTVAVGLEDEFRHGLQNWTGQVDVYHFKNGNWSRTRIPRPDVVTFGDVQLSDNGYVLVVGASTIGNDVKVYKSINGTWTNIFTSNFSAENTFCETWRLSRDGKSLALLCADYQDQGGFHPVATRSYVRVLSGSQFATRVDIPLELGYSHVGLAVDDTASTIAVGNGKETEGEPTTEGFVRIYKRAGNAYQQVAQLEPGPWKPAQRRVTFAATLAMSGDARTLVVGDPSDNGAGVGPLPPPLTASSVESGAAYVYQFDLPSNSWKLVKLLKRNYYNPSQPNEFGRPIRVSRTGDTVAIGMWTEDSSASGIDGNWQSSNQTDSGAVFMY